MKTTPIFNWDSDKALHRRAVILVLVSILLTSWLAGCAEQPGVATTTPSVTPAATISRPAASPTAPTPAATRSDGVITLTWWTPEFLSPQAPQPGGQILARQLADFERANAGQTRVTAQLKARYGRGGLLDLLRAAQHAAPSILPDIVTLDVIELEQAFGAGLLEPLDGALDEDVVRELYPFARSAGEFQGQLMAVQYMADFEHGIYLTEMIQRPPERWDDLLSSDATPFLFALGAPQASATTSRFKSLQHAVLSQYLSAGATVDAATRQPALEEIPLQRLLGFYKTASDTGLLPPNALELRDADTIWDIFEQGRVPMAQISARRYLAERESLTGVRFTAAPGWAGPVVPIADGWALAVVTTDPARQRAALELIAWLLRPDNAGALAAAVGWLPTSPAALDRWGRTAYHEFVASQLAVARSQPNGATYAQTVTRLQTAIVAVLSEGVSPQDATAAALAPAR